MAQLVSILIPAYNAEKWLAAAVETAKAQIWPKKEIIIVDDGSSDDTRLIAKACESQIIKAINQENRGASAARNKALSFAQGDYIQWLDADNLLAPDKISSQMKSISENKRILLSSGWGRFYYRFQKAAFSPTSLWMDLSPIEWIYRKLNEDIYIIPECWLVSRELTGMAGPWDENLSLDDDGEYFTRLITCCEEIRFVPEAKSYYRSGNVGSLSSIVKRTDKKLESQFLAVCSQISSLLSLENSIRTRRACLNFLQANFLLFYPEKKNLVERARKLAHELGGDLSVPKFGWKYSFLRKLFGWEIAKEMQFKMPVLKMLIEKNCDKLMAVAFQKRILSK